MGRLQRTSLSKFRGPDLERVLVEVTAVAANKTRHGTRVSSLLMRRGKPQQFSIELRLRPCGLWAGTRRTNPLVTNPCKNE